MSSELFDDLFIFEMANNHQGSVDHGVKIIQAMAEVARSRGVRAAIKFQYRDLDTFIHPDFVGRDDVKHIPRFLSTRLSAEQFGALGAAARKAGLMVAVTPFDEASVGTCIDHDVDIIKVASCSAMDWPLLERIAGAGKPVIVSTGGLGIYDIDNVVSFLTHREIDFALMHCVALYPAANDKLQMNFLSKMIRRYPNVTVGYSGHEAPDNPDPVKVAVSKGARILERHVGVATDEITLNAYSMAPAQADAWVAAALAAKDICGGDEEKTIDPDETASLLSLQRGAFAAGPIKAGDAIGKADVFFAMPATDGQVTSGEFGRKWTTFTASRDYKPDEPLIESPTEDTISMIRGIIHDAKGMIYEAGIAVGSEFQIDLSHHYGIERFREVGALVVNVINRDYCKKIIVQLPGQVHPNHYHQRKEETFQLLWGGLEMNLDGQEVLMKPGDAVLIAKGAWHSFTTSKGAIIEEISTTHIRDDSYYEDPAIAALDPLERKTVVENW